MKVLQLCPKPSQPAIDGGCIAINNITSGFISKGIEVQVLTISTQKHPFKKESFSEEFLEKTKIKGIFVDTKLNVVDAFSNLVTSDSYNISRFFSSDFDLEIRRILENNKFDVIHLESLFMTPYVHTIRRFTDAKIILRSHNLEYMIWERLANAASNPAKKVYLKILAKQLKKYETNVFSSLDGIAAISIEDQKKYENLGCKKPIVTIPFGIDVNNYQPAQTRPYSAPLQLFHIGAMDWKPNIEGMSWFLDAIWPALADSDVKPELHLAGRKMPDWLINHDIKNMINHNEVDCAQEFMRAYDVMVVPLLSAGGMRVKIIEGMALGKVVISTKVGAEGIDYTDGENILIADTQEEYLEKITWLHQNSDKILEIGENAKKLVNDYYNNDLITDRLLNFYKTVQQA